MCQAVIKGGCFPIVTVKKAAERTGLTVKAIRYYENAGLLSPVDRTESGYRLYSKEDLERLRQIQFYRSVKLSIQDIIKVMNGGPKVRQKILTAQLTKVKRERSEYERAEALLQSSIASEAVQERRTQNPHPSHIAVIGIDLQNDFSEGGALPCKRIRSIVPRLKELFAKARSAGIPIIYICDSHHKGEDEELRIWGDHCIDGSWGASILSDLNPEPQDYIVKKKYFNGFVHTNLQTILDGLGVDTLLFTGWRSDVCITQTAVEAFYRGFRVLVAKDGVNSTTAAEHEAGIKLMQINYDFEMYPCATILEDALATEAE